MSSRPRILLLSALALLSSACHDSASSAHHASTATTAASGPAVTTATATTTVPLGPAIVFAAQGSELDAYSTTRPFTAQTVVRSPAADRNGVDVSGQICFDPTNPRRFVAVDRTAAADGQSGWGVFELSGRTLGKLSAKEIARLVPSYQDVSATAGPTPFGCGFLADGRLLTTDSGNPTSAAATGQLVEWFPPYDQDVVSACKIDVALAAPMAVLVDGDQVYVAENGGRGVTSFDPSTFPTSNRPGDGCSSHDSTGHRLASGVVRAAWLQNTVATGLERPTAVVPAGNGDFYVSVPRTGVITEVTAAGVLVRRVLVPPAGEALGSRPFSTGTPEGLGVGPDGTLYYVDPGLVGRGGRLVPGLRTGTIRRITFTGGVPQRPEVMAGGLQSPSGIAIWNPSA